MYYHSLQQEAVGNLRKAQSLYVTRQQEYEKAKELAQKVESDALSASSGNTSLVAKIDKRKKVEEDAAHRVSFIIKKTCPCNIERCFSAVKIENFIGKIEMFLIFLLKTLIMSTC